MYKPSTADGSRRVRIPRIATTVGALLLLPLLAAGCVFDGDDDSATTLPSNGASASPVNGDAQPVRQDSIALTKDGFEPDAVEVDEGAVVRVSNNTDGPMTIIVSGGDSGTEFEIPAGAEIEITLASPGARVITVPGDSGLTATVMVRSTRTPDAR
jgi:hypothetical protein